MRAMVLHEFGGSLKLEDVPIPKIGRHDVLIKNKACGVGLTISHIKDRPRVGAKIPLILGHEVAGEVTEVGEDVQNIEVGDHATVYFYMSCGTCKWCRVGREPLCEKLRGHIGVHTGLDWGGGYAEYMKVPAENVFKLPKEVPFEEACIVADAIATPLHVVRERAKVRPLEVVVVVGAGGGVGIHVVQMAKLFGGRVIGVDILKEKLDKVKEVGGDEVINVKDAPEFDEEVKRLTDGRGADVVIDFVCREETIEAGFRSLATSGRQVILAVHPGVIIKIPPEPFIRGELILTGSRYASKQDFVESIEIMRRGLVKPIVTKTFPLEEANRVHEMLENKEIVGRAVLLI